MLQICLKTQSSEQSRKGSGTGEMGVIEELTFEGYGPNGVAILS